MCADMYIEKGGKRITSLKMMVNTAIRQKYAKEIFSEGLCSVLHPLTETEVELHFNETNPAFKHSTSTWPKATFGLMLFPRC